MKPVPIAGYEKLYSVTEDGCVYSHRYKKYLLQRRVKGYAITELFNNYKRKSVLIHRVVALAFIPNPNNYPQVNHLDFNRLNNAIENLEWCTAKQNIGHSLRAGRMVQPHSLRNLLKYPPCQNCFHSFTTHHWLRPELRGKCRNQCDCRGYECSIEELDAA